MLIEDGWLRGTAYEDSEEMAVNRRFVGVDCESLLCAIQFLVHIHDAVLLSIDYSFSSTTLQLRFL